MNLQEHEMYDAHSSRVPRAAWNRVMRLLDLASREIEHRTGSAHATLVLATSLLKEQIRPQPACAKFDFNEGLLRWQVRKLLGFIEARVAPEDGRIELPPAAWGQAATVVTGG